ncbi:MAG TPA: hypothetical protein VLF20_04700, partial [Patescibacteria group bacterium]|nr:hypothetical protein [Patescibacteria group bacterium]
MKKFNIIHFGIGHVGSEVVAQIAKQKNQIKKSLGVDLVYQAKIDAKTSDAEINTMIKTISEPFLVIDTTASEKTLFSLKEVLRKGGFVVLANKKPISGEQKDFDLLHTLGGKKFLYECTVGAGLPVIQTIKSLQETGDEVLEMQGCLSGTLGFIFSQLDNGVAFSQAVLDAKAKGFTEPDPRDDLSGIDVARKALILARICGRKFAFEDIKLEGLYPVKMAKLSLEDFLKDLPVLDSVYKEKMEKAKKKKQVLRFVAKITEKEVLVGLQAVDKTSDIGSLRGPDNLVVIKSKRYFDNPLVIKG